MIEARFPTSLSRGASGGDSFDNRITGLPGGTEQRIGKRSIALGRWSMSFNNRDKTAFQELRNFFLAVGGMLNAFRFKDPLDYESDTAAPGQSCSPATGDGANKLFQLQKSYTVTSPLSPYVRTVTKPVSGTVRMYVNGVEVLSPGNWSVSTTTGIVTFVAAPTGGHTVKATYEFDKIVRFAEDMRDSSIDAYNIYTWSQISVQEVLG